MEWPFFPESEKFLIETEISQEIPETPKERAIFAKFQAPKFANSEPEKMQWNQPFHTPTRIVTRFPPNFRVKLKGNN